MLTTWRIEHQNVATHRIACDDPRRFTERVERLRRLGERGEVVLIEVGTGLVVARRRLGATSTLAADSMHVRTEGAR